MGPRRISGFIEALVKPHVAKEDVTATYRATARDEAREAEALEWADDTAQDVADQEAGRVGLDLPGDVVAREPIQGRLQTLSRFNRAHPSKHDCFGLDFQNNSEAITFAFQDYYRTTLLADETDPNKLHDLKGALDAAQVYVPEQVDQLVGRSRGSRP